ncbi:hypothetical protein GCM10010307_30830 [Streptomyces vastus]|uniref:Integrase catalytic domain-containing protein n=1 Tax=Streptomyces vastus TaxID=285451 RepID=A0ABN3QU01_9ACTN
MDWLGPGLTVLKDRVRDLRPAYRPADPASRTVYEPGEIGQCDLWFPPADIPLGFGQVGRPPVLVMVAGYSRWITARMLPSRSAADLIAGHWRLLTELGAVPRVLVWDNEGAVGSWRSGAPTHRRIRRVRRTAGHQVPALQVTGASSQGPGRTGQRLSRDVVPARAGC